MSDCAYCGRWPPSQAIPLDKSSLPGCGRVTLLSSPSLPAAKSSSCAKASRLSISPSAPSICTVSIQRAIQPSSKDGYNPLDVVFLEGTAFNAVRDCSQLKFALALVAVDGHGLLAVPIRCVITVASGLPRRSDLSHQTAARRRSFSNPRERSAYRFPGFSPGGCFSSDPDSFQQPV